MIVIPFSRSRSRESITRSTTAAWALKMPLCRSIASTRVVFPWSTWAMIATLRMSAVLGFMGGALREGAREELPDRFSAVLFEEAGSRPGEAGVADADRLPAFRFDPPVVLPGEPGVLPLVEDEDRFVAQLGELGPPPGAALHRPVGEDRTDHVDHVAGVDLVPDRLQDLPDRRSVRVGAVQEVRHVGEAHVAFGQFLPGEDADAAGAGDLPSFVREIDLLDSVPFRLRAELRLGADGTAAVEDAILLLEHLRLLGMVGWNIGHYITKAAGSRSNVL